MDEVPGTPAGKEEGPDLNALFLILIYLAFVSLGLPDTLLGSAWPVMRPELGVSLDAQGLITVIVSCATIVSCLLNGKLVRRLGTGKITALSGAITAAALLGYAWSPSYAWLLLFSVPLGLGAGSVDTCLNNYAALHFSARHVNWMACCYGLGAALGPLLLSLLLGGAYGWRSGYLLIACIQCAIAALLAAALPVWRGRDYRGEAGVGDQGEGLPCRPLARIPGVPAALLSYALAFSVEYGTALWAPSYLVGLRGLSPESAARTVSLFYLCIMVGRFLSGILSLRLSDRALIRLGGALCMAGAVCLALPLPPAAYYAALGAIGLGCAPIFPAMIHLTPARFGPRDAQRVMGVQMAAAYAGDVCLAPLIGVTAQRAGEFSIPWSLLLLTALLLVCTEITDLRAAGRRRA